MEGRPPDDDDVVFPPPPEVDETGEETETGDAGLRGSLADGVKKALLAGVGALFMTEEGARRLARDWKLPKEVSSFLGQQATTAKDELLRLFGDEIRRFLESESLRREFLRALSENTIEIRAEIRLRPAGEGPPKPEVTAEVKPRRRTTGKRSRR